MQSRSRFCRFDPVTVRAAARVLRLASAGRLDPYEVEIYLRHLADMDPSASDKCYLRLQQVARRWAALHSAGLLCSVRPGVVRRAPDWRGYRLIEPREV